MKGCSTPLTMRNANQNNNRIPYAHQIKTNIRANVEQLSAASTAGGNKTVQPLWKTARLFLPKLNTAVAYNLAIPRETEACPFRIMYLNVHSDIMHNSQEVETNQTSINEWMDKNNMLHSSKKKWTKYTAQNEWTLKTGSERSPLRKSTCCKIPFTWNVGESVTTS